MLKNVMAFVLTCVALSACAVSGGSLVPASSPSAVAVSRSVGSLNVEPFAIVFSGRKAAPSQLVRVWQRGYRGRYVASNRCVGVTVALRKYTQRDASLWDVSLNRTRRETCSVKFSGSGGHRGTNYLQIKILQ
jgi:hypothetical protein